MLKIQKGITLFFVEIYMHRPFIISS